MNDLPRFQPSPLLATMTEKMFQDTVEEMGSYLGYRSWHNYDARKSAEGWPDLVMVGSKIRQVVYFELKKEPKSDLPSALRDVSPSVPQVQWLNDLRLAGSHAYVIRPSDIDVAELILRGYFAPPHLVGDEVIVDPALARLIEHESHAIVRRKSTKKRKKGWNPADVEARRKRVY